MGVTDFIALVALYIEIGVLGYFDYRMWRTMYTPLNMLMLPYAAVLVINLLACGNMGIVEFYYPSLMVWMVGLLLYAIPSYFFYFAFRDKILKDDGAIEDNMDMRVLNVISTILVALFIMRFISMLGSSKYLPGSDDFGHDFSGSGVWAHLHRVLNALAIIYIYKYDKKHWYYIPLILGMFFVTFMHGVKSWVLIPFVSGLSMRLYAGKTKLKLSLIINIMIVAFLVFVITYSISLILGMENAAEFSVVFEIICNLFVHYVISGIVGWSQDLQMGILEQQNFDILIANILNIYYAITGEEFVKIINPFFIHNGVTGSNVRSFFATIYIYSTLFQFVVFVLVSSALTYLMRLLAMATKGAFMYVTYFFIMGMLIMGWFEYYYYHLACLEVPACIFLLYMIARKPLDDKNKNNESC